MKAALLILSLALAFASRIEGATIDFEDLPAGPIPGESVTYTVGTVPVTFSGLDLSVDLGNPFPGNRTLRSGTYYDPIMVRFEAGFTANFVQIRNPFDSMSPVETDIIRGDAYSPSGVLLATVISSNAFHRIDAPGIGWVIYDDVADTAFAMDDFMFEIVPEPTTLTLLGAGLALAAMRLFARRAVNPRRRA